MKKWLASLLALMLLFTAAAPAGLAEETFFVPEEDEEALIFTPVEEEFEEEPVRITAPKEEAFAVSGGVLTAYNGTDADVTVPAGVTAIGEEAFAGNASLRTVTLPESALEIGEGAFADCPKLEKVSAPGVKKVGARAFIGCAALQETVFAEGAEIADDAFALPEPSATKPTITSQPSSKKIVLGGAVFFSVSATGATSYRWQTNAGSEWKDVYDGSFYSGATTGTLRFTSTSGINNVRFRCAVRNSAGTVYSNAVTFSVLNKPVVTSQPSSKSMVAGQQVFFDVKATDAASYRWQYYNGTDWKNLFNDATYSGVTGGTLKFTAKSTLSGRKFRCQITNAAGTVNSNTVTFTLIEKPVFTSQPSSKTVAMGARVYFAAKVSNNPTYRWQYYDGSAWKDLYNDATFSGVTTTTLQFTSKDTLNGRKFRLKAWNAAGTAYSQTVTFKCLTKPTITGNPTDKVIAEGYTVTFSATVTGTASYRWQANSGSGWKDIYDGSFYSGTTTKKLTFTAKASVSGVQFRLKAYNDAGTVYSSAATFTLKVKPTITQNPTSQTVAAGYTVTFTGRASNASTYRWQSDDGNGWRDLYNDSTFSGVTTTTLKFTAKSSLNGRRFRLAATGNGGTAYSTAATFTLAVSKPVITQNPSSQTVTAGYTVTFTAGASGATSYRWQYNAGSGWKDLFDGSVYSGTTTTRLTFTSVTSLSGIQYRLSATNAGGTVYSSAATFTAQAVSKPTITQNPTSQTVAAGYTVTFTASASGATAYRWQYNAGSGWKDLYDGSVYSGTTTYRLSFTAVASLSGIQYRLSASNAGGTVYSSAATFTLKTVDKPVITSQPISQTVSEGYTVVFTVGVTGATSYRWQYNAGSGWKDLYDGSVYSGTATTRLSFTATSSLSGIQYRLSATNAGGTVYSGAATFVMQSVSITLSRTTATIKNGASLTLTANTSVTWSSSNTSVATVSSSGVVFGVYPGTATITARAGSSSATCRVTVQANYRALLVSQMHFDPSHVPEGQGATQYRWTTARDQWATILRSRVHGPDGGSYTVTTDVDLTASQILNKAASTFSGARDGDVSLIALFTHGDESSTNNYYAGALLCYNSTYLYMPDLANVLAKVPGKVIVIVEACGSGALTRSFSGSAGGESDVDFTRSIISAFAEADPMLRVKEFNEIEGDAMITVPEPDTNEFLTSKFIILAAAGYRETQWGYDGTGPGSGGLYMTDEAIKAIGTSGSFPADTQYGNSDGKLTMRELWSYIYNQLAYKSSYWQKPNIYPSDGSYVLFIR